MGYATYSQFNATTQSTGAWIDVSPATQPDSPPVMIVSISGGTATVLIEGSHDTTNVYDFSNGGLTGNSAKDLIPGIRFWRTRVTAINNATVTSSVGPVPTIEGGFSLPGNQIQQTGGPA